MEFYLQGALVVFIIGVVKLIIAFVEMFSQRAQNLKRIDFYWDFWSGHYLPTKRSKLTFVFSTIYLLFITPLFSWLSVAFFALTYLLRKTYQIIPPDRIKEIQYKLANVDLPKKEVLSLKKELDSFLGVKEEDDPANVLDLQSEESDWTEMLTVNPSKMTFEVVDHPSDYQVVNYSTCQYKIEGDKVMVRLLELKSDIMGKTHYCVRDNVVLEQAIIEDMKDNPFQSATETEKIAEMKKEVEWSEMQDYRIRYFLLQKHPEVISVLEFRKSVRAYIERVQSGNNKLRDFAKQKNYDLVDTQFGSVFKAADGTSESAEKEFEASMSEESLRDKFNISFDEYVNYKRYIANLTRWLEPE